MPSRASAANKFKPFSAARRQIGRRLAAGRDTSISLRGRPLRDLRHLQVPRAGEPSLAPDTKRFEDSNALSDAVAADPNGIGFVGLPFVRSARAIPVSDQNTAPLLPSAFTVAREDYVFSRRLFLYTPANPPNPLTLRFIRFATSDAGQEIVAREGFVNQIVKKEEPKVPGPAAAAPAGDLPPEYATPDGKCRPVERRLPLPHRQQSVRQQSAWMTSTASPPT